MHPDPTFFADASKVDASTPQPGQLLTVGGVARIVGRSPTRIRELCAELCLPDTRAGNVRVFDAAAVAKLKAEVERRQREALR